MAELIYNIASETLYGELNGKKIHVRAGSGGRSGSKTNGAFNYFLANNPLATNVKLDKSRDDSSGATLPIGTYTLQTKKEMNGKEARTKSNWIRLEPDKSNQMFKRDGFAIHGRGARGSDGCIVPFDFNVVVAIFHAVVANEAAGKDPFVLKVIAQGSNLDKKMKQFNSLA